MPDAEPPPGAVPEEGPAPPERVLETMQHVEQRLVQELKSGTAVGELGHISQRLGVLNSQVAHLEGAVGQIERDLGAQQHDAQVLLRKELLGLRRDVNAYLIAVTLAVLLLVLLVGVFVLSRMG